MTKQGSQDSAIYWIPVIAISSTINSVTAYYRFYYIISILRLKSVSQKWSFVMFMGKVLPFFFKF